LIIYCFSSIIEVKVFLGGDYYIKKFNTSTIIMSTNGILYTEAFKSATRESERYFTRERQLTFVRCFHLMLSFMTKSLQIEINNFFEVSGLVGTVSKQAFSKARNKIK